MTNPLCLNIQLGRAEPELPSSPPPLLSLLNLLSIAPLSICVFSIHSPASFASFHPQNSICLSRILPSSSSSSVLHSPPLASVLFSLHHCHPTPHHPAPPVCSSPAAVPPSLLIITLVFLFLHSSDVTGGACARVRLRVISLS